MYGVKFRVKLFRGVIKWGLRFVFVEVMEYWVEGFLFCGCVFIVVYELFWEINEIIGVK